MVESINNYTFDFTAEAAHLRHEMDWLADDVVFVNIADDGTGKVAFRHIDRPPVTARETLAGALHDMAVRLHVETAAEVPENDLAVGLRDIASRFKGEKGSCFSGLSRQYDYRFICLDQRDAGMFGEANSAMRSLFALYHEAGHASIRQGAGMYAESAADAYAALRLLQRFGPDAVPLLSMWSWFRAYCPIYGWDDDHFSTFTLDQVIADFSSRDFSPLQHKEAAELAANYASACLPDLSELLDFCARMKAHKGMPLENILGTILSSGDFPPMAFYAAAKVAQPFLTMEGIILNGKPVTFSDHGHQALASAIAARKISLQDLLIIDKLPAPALRLPAAETLKVPLPKGQKQLVLNY